MEQETTEKPSSEKAESKSSLVVLTSSGFTILGLLYLMGFVIVNGYQAKYLNYSASAVQLKHVAAGLLYSFLTFLQVSVVANLLVVQWSDRHQRKEAAPETPVPIEPSTERQEKRGVLERFLSPLKSAGSALGATIRLFQKHDVLNSLLTAVFVYAATFWFIGTLGNSALPDRYSGLLIVKACWGWVLTNLVMAGLVTITITSMARQRAKAVEELYKRFQSSLSGAEPEDETISAPDTSALKVSFAEAMAGRWLAMPLFAGVLMFFSLTSFQGLYGRLKADYGGGALYRVEVHLAPANATTSSPDEIQTRMRSKDSWLLLVDRDSSFVYVVSVDKDGNRNLMQIALSEIKGLEVSSAPPFHPEDVPFFIQQELKNKTSE